MVSKSIAILQRAKHFLKNTTMYSITYTVPSYFHACVTVGKYGGTHIKPIQSQYILQKSAIRTISNVEYRQPNHQLFIKLKTLKFRDLVDFKTAQIMYNIIHQVPHSIQGLFWLRDSKYGLRGICMYRKPK